MKQEPIKEVIVNIKLKRRSYYFPGLTWEENREIIKRIKKGLKNVKVIGSFKAWELLNPCSSDNIIIKNTERIVIEAGSGKVFEGKGNGAAFLYFFNDEIKGERLYEEWNEYLQNNYLLKFVKRPIEPPKKYKFCKALSTIFSFCLTITFLAVIAVLKFVFSFKLNLDWQIPIFFSAVSLDIINFYWSPRFVKRLIKKFQDSLFDRCNRLITISKKR